MTTGDTLYFSRASKQPFQTVGGFAIISEKVQMSDSVWGANSFSVQLNMNGADKWIQTAVTIKNGVLFNWWLYAADNKGTRILYAPVPLPGWETLIEDDVIGLEIEDTGSQLIAYMAAESKDSPNPFEPKGRAFPFYDEMCLGSFVVRGMSDGSIGAFTSGSFNCGFDADSIEDLLCVTGRQESLPYIDVGPLNPGITAELANLTQKLTQITPIGAPFSARFTTRL